MVVVGLGAAGRDGKASWLREMADRGWAGWDEEEEEDVHVGREIDADVDTDADDEAGGSEGKADDDAGGR